MAGRRLSPLLAVRAGAAVVGAALTVRRAYRRHPLPEAVARLRGAAPLPEGLRDPILHQRLAARLLPLLPPWRMGRCLKGSLVLLHLWTRCGVAVRLHLGVGEARTAHAWLTTEDGALASGRGDGFVEVTVL